MKKRGDNGKTWKKKGRGGSQFTFWLCHRKLATSALLARLSWHLYISQDTTRHWGILHTLVLVEVAASPSWAAGVWATSRRATERLVPEMCGQTADTSVHGRWSAEFFANADWRGLFHDECIFPNIKVENRKKWMCWDAHSTVAL